MADLLLVATIALDRIWRLDGPLRPGARIAWRSVTTRHGGGGINTGTELVRLGHRVRVAGVVRDDAQGRESLAEMERRGLDASLMAVLPGESTITEILVEPGGERTLIFPPRVAGPRPGPARLDADLVYVNAGQLPDATDRALAEHPRVVAQFPRLPNMAHPARWLIASRSDVPDEAPDTLFARGQALCPGAWTLVITDGRRPVTVVEDGRETLVPVPDVVQAEDTTGAGDVFAAGMIDALVRGGTIEDAVRQGMMSAARHLAG